MLFIVLLIVLFIFIWLFKVKHISINLKSFKYKRARVIDDRFGVYLITGKQGSNKTYYACQLTYNQDKSKVNYIKTNIHLFNQPDDDNPFVKPIDHSKDDSYVKIVEIKDGYEYSGGYRFYIM